MSARRHPYKGYDIYEDWFKLALAMLLATILILLLFGNWFLTETLIFLPINLANRFVSLGWWGLALIVLLFFAWCMAQD